VSVKRGLGWIPDKPDERDHRLVKLGLPATVPAAFSLASDVVEVLDQGDSSSCVAHAFAQAVRIADIVAGVAAPPLTSREFLYFNSRAFDGPPIVDEGTQLRSCARGLTKFGRPPETAWPFVMTAINERPTWEAYREAYDYKGPSAYLRVTGNDEIKQALAASKPVCGGVSLGSSIFDYTGGIYDPDPNEPSVGGHALCIVGYDTDSFTIVNSWGPGYGEAGFLRVSPTFMATFSDLWCLHE
jgi:C1A family cysteine protease